MIASSPLDSRAQRLADWLVCYWLPVGWLALLTGMFWVGDRSLYHKLFYALLAAPTLLAAILAPQRLAPLWRSPLLRVFLLFAGYVVLSLSWSPDGELSLVKHPLYILLLFLASGLLILEQPQLLQRLLLGAALLAGISALVTLGWYLRQGGAGRLTGYGALYNPLLTTHVYGFFAAVWLAAWCSNLRLPAYLPLLMLAILGLLILCTGSRTPLVALTASMLWLLIARPNRRSRLLVVVPPTVFALDPGIVTARGVSYRPAIWQDAWHQILEAPWLGHGYDAAMRIKLPGLTYPLADPHNLSLGVTYQTGLVGLALWFALYTTALFQGWRLRHDKLVLVASTTVVFGLVAGMTEGSSFMSRPKEHWFLIWIPLALLTAAVLHARIRSGDAGQQLPESGNRPELNAPA